MQKSFTTKELFSANLKCDRLITILHSIPVDDETMHDFDVAFHMILNAKRKIENRMHIEYARKKLAFG